MMNFSKVRRGLMMALLAGVAMASAPLPAAHAVEIKGEAQDCLHLCRHSARWWLERGAG